MPVNPTPFKEQYRTRLRETVREVLVGVMLVVSLAEGVMGSLGWVPMPATVFHLLQVLGVVIVVLSIIALVVVSVRWTEIYEGLGLYRFR